ncbi:MAG TPA: hypothetical protein EYP98_03960 [Planctomycetes bacterium]|nr:hypothetical protein [Planctomycetota bacterium]
MLGRVAAVVSFNVCGSRLAAVRAQRLLPRPFEPLPDIGHDILPRVPLHTPDVMLLLVAAACAWRYNSLVHCAAAVSAATWCGALRGVMVHLTVLPSPLPPAAWGGTHDLMFSGHTICFCAAAEMLACGWLAPAGAAALVAARAHYTMDVVVAALAYAAARRC